MGAEMGSPAEELIGKGKFALPHAETPRTDGTLLDAGAGAGDQARLVFEVASGDGTPQPGHRAPRIWSHSAGSGISHPPRTGVFRKASVTPLVPACRSGVCMPSPRHRVATAVKTSSFGGTVTPASCCLRTACDDRRWRLSPAEGSAIAPLIFWVAAPHR